MSDTTAAPAAAQPPTQTNAAPAAAQPPTQTNAKTRGRVQRATSLEQLGLQKL